jgi:scyllo-inositol 2-dehydrogenase (NADP+)
MNPLSSGSKNPIRIGIAGLGRSGWNIHAHALGEMSDLYEIVAVMDLDEARRNEAAARFNCRTYDDFSALAQDAEVEAIVVATPNFLHKSNVVEVLQNGKHAICEKPFGQNSAEADEMIAAAQRAGKLVAPFQNRRYEPHFQKVKEIIESGLLGEVHFIRLAWHGFKRRWDWQTLSEFGGGDLNNNGPHILDHALQLFGAEEPEVFIDLRNVLSSGDAEDHVKITLKAPGSPTIDVELMSGCAFPQDRWLVMGDAGGLRGSVNHLDWKWVDWSELEERNVERTPTPDRGYNSETLPWQSDSCETGEGLDLVVTQFYEDLYRSVRHGEPLFITPESVRRTIALIEECKQNADVVQGRFALVAA